MKELSPAQDVKRITLIGFIFNLALGMVKMWIGVLAHSQGLFADGIHSLSDLLTDSLVFAAAHFGSQHPDHEHPYGHARIETVATTLIAFILLFASASIIYEAWWHIRYGTIVIPHFSALCIALFSILINEWLYQRTIHIALKHSSELLKTNAWHHRSDAASSMVVLIGILATLCGYAYLDAIAAVVVGLLIAKMAISLVYTSFRELIDTAVDDETLKQIKFIISSVSGVTAIHQLRTRSMAGKVLVDVHVLVDSELSVSEGHHISQQVHHTLREKCDVISDVIVHIDPEDDETTAPSLHLPSRASLLPLLQDAWRNLPGFDEIKRIKLHYLDGIIYVDVYLPFRLAKEILTVDELKKSYQEAVQASPFSLIVKIYFG